MKSLYLIFSEVCDFDDSPCSWKIGNWTKRKGNVPSEGTGPPSDAIDSKCTGHGRSSSSFTFIKREFKFPTTSPG